MNRKLNCHNGWKINSTMLPICYSMAQISNFPRIEFGAPIAIAKYAEIRTILESFNTSRKRNAVLSGKPSTK